MTDHFNIIHLIEKNAKDYENKMIDKIKKNFKNEEQQLFVASFYCYLKYNDKKDFIIDFDDVWKWVGFTRKGKRLQNFAFPIGEAKIMKILLSQGRKQKMLIIFASPIEEAKFNNKICSTKRWSKKRRTRWS
jgi:hypothetical protein